MMTLREMINHVMDRGASLHVYACICDTYYKGEDMMNVSNTFTSVIRELIESAPSVDSDITTDHQLLIRNLVDGEKEYAEVVLQDTTDGNIYAVDFVNWGDLMDLVVQDNAKIPLEIQLAHVLYEITFWGWTADTIQKEKQKLSDEREDVMPLSGIDELLN